MIKRINLQLFSEPPTDPPSDPPKPKEKGGEDGWQVVSKQLSDLTKLLTPQAQQKQAEGIPVPKQPEPPKQEKQEEAPPKQETKKRGFLDWLM